MGFIEKLAPHTTDTKKMISARVSKDVMLALNNAAEDMDALGYAFSITKIIDKAFSDTLEELKQITGIDYYKLIKWRKKMESTQELAEHVEGFNPVDFDEGIKIIKEYQLMTFGLDSVRDFDTQLQEEKESLFKHWNTNLRDCGAILVPHDDGSVSLSALSDTDSNTKSSSKYVSGHTVETLSKLLKKSTDEVINILNNAGVTGKSADSHISTDDRKKLMKILSGRYSKNSNIKLK